MARPTRAPTVSHQASHGSCDGIPRHAVSFHEMPLLVAAVCLETLQVAGMLQHVAATKVKINGDNSRQNSLNVAGCAGMSEHVGACQGMLLEMARQAAPFENPAEFFKSNLLLHKFRFLRMESAKFLRDTAGSRDNIPHPVGSRREFPHQLSWHAVVSHVEFCAMPRTVAEFHVGYYGMPRGVTWDVAVCLPRRSHWMFCNTLPGSQTMCTIVPMVSLPTATQVTSPSSLPQHHSSDLNYLASGRHVAGRSMGSHGMSWCAAACQVGSRGMPWHPMGCSATCREFPH